MSLMLAKVVPKGPDPVVARIFATHGLRSRIADACGIRPQAVTQWKRVPPHWVRVVADITGLTPEQIRPDIFGTEKRR